jgi:outer membrane biosynthesis protein TonB
MGLSDDQKALLRLLAGGQGYDDIAALLGTSVDEVKAKAGAAVEQLEAEGIPAPALPGAGPRTPADPEPPSDPPPPPAPPPVPPAPEPPLKPAPADPEPPSDPPPSTAVTPESPKPAAEAPVAATRPSSGGGRPKLSLPADQGKRAALAAGAIVVALIVVVLIVSGGGGGGDSSTTAASDTTASESSESSQAESGQEGESQSASSGSAKLTKAVLTSVGGGNASGVAIFGRVKKSLALQVQAQGLEPTGSNDSYTVWLAQSPQKMLPLASTAVKKDGRIAEQFEVPVEVLAYLASETFDQIVVTHTDNAKLQAALKKATKEEKAPTYTGEAVLSGQVTGRIVGIQKRAEESKAEKKE